MGGRYDDALLDRLVPGQGPLTGFDYLVSRPDNCATADLPLSIATH